jgi:hypothetical protein
MPLIRLTAFLVLAAIAVSLAFYAFTKDIRYIRFAWQTLKLAVVLAVIVALFYLLERLVLIA